MIATLPEEVSSALSTMSSSVGALSEIVAGHLHKKRKTKAANIDSTLGHAHDLINAYAVRNLLDSSVRINIFPSKFPSST